MEIETKLESKIQDEILSLENKHKAKLQKYEMFRECLDGSVFDSISEIFDDYNVCEYVSKAFENKGKNKNFHIEVRNNNAFKKLELNNCYYEMLESILNFDDDSNRVKEFLVEKSKSEKPNLSSVKDIFGSLIEKYINLKIKDISEEVTYYITCYHEKIKKFFELSDAFSLGITENVTIPFFSAANCSLSSITLTESEKLCKLTGDRSHLKQLTEVSFKILKRYSPPSLDLSLLESVKDNIEKALQKSNSDGLPLGILGHFVWILHEFAHKIENSSHYTKRAKEERLKFMGSCENMLETLDIVQNNFLSLVSCYADDKEMIELKGKKDELETKKENLEKRSKMLPDMSQMVQERENLKSQVAKKNDRIKKLSSRYNADKADLIMYEQGSSMVRELFDMKSKNEDLIDMSVVLDDKLSHLKTRLKELESKSYEKDLGYIINQNELVEILKDNMRLKNKLDISIKNKVSGFEKQNISIIFKQNREKGDIIQEFKKRFEQVRRAILSYKINYISGSSHIEKIDSILEKKYVVEPFRQELKPNMDNKAILALKNLYNRVSASHVCSLMNDFNKTCDACLSLFRNFPSYPTQGSELKSIFYEFSEQSYNRPDKPEPETWAKMLTKRLIELDIADLEPYVCKLQKAEKLVHSVTCLKKELCEVDKKINQLSISVGRQARKLELFRASFNASAMKEAFSNLQSENQSLEEKIAAKKKEIEEYKLRMEIEKFLKANKEKSEKYLNRLAKNNINDIWNPLKRNDVVKSLNEMKFEEDGIIRDLNNELICVAKSENLTLSNKLKEIKINEKGYDNLLVANANNESNFTLFGSKSIQKNK